MADDLHPFFRWFAGMLHSRAARANGRDVVLTDVGGKRFAVGVDGDGMPVLGVQKGDLDLLMSLKWRRATFLKGWRFRDWIGLHCPNAAPDTGEEAQEAQPVRVWIPVNKGLLGAWKGTPRKLRIKEMRVGKYGKPVLASAKSVADVPVDVKDGGVKKRAKGAAA